MQFIDLNIYIIYTTLTRDTSIVTDFVSVLFVVLESIQIERRGTSFSARCFSGLLPSLRVALDTKKGSVIGRKGRPAKGSEGSCDAVRSSRPTEKGRKRLAGSRKSKAGPDTGIRFRVPRPRASHGRYFRIPGEPTPTPRNREQSNVTWNIDCAFISRSCKSWSSYWSYLLSLIVTKHCARGEFYLLIVKIAIAFFFITEEWT